MRPRPPLAARRGSAWLQVPAADYEAHMAHPAVGQSAVLAGLLAEAVSRQGPRRLLLCGCATGNGLEVLAGRSLERITAVDLQPAYLDLVRARHAAALPTLELVQADLEEWRPVAGAYDLIWCALLLEYLDSASFLRRMADALAAQGRLHVVLQLPAAGQQPVTATPFTSLRVLEDAMRLVDPRRLATEAAAAGLRCLEERRLPLASGKAFHLAVFTA
jgi:trans-aconitate methyltransferase